MGSADMRGLRFADAQESRFQACKLSYMARAVLQRGKFAEFHELRFQTAKHQIWAVPKRKHFDFLTIRNRVFWLRIVKYRQCCPAIRLIC